VNAAAYTAVDRAETEPDCAFAVNRDGAAHLARSARTLGIPFINVSTDYVFDGSKDSPYYEDDVAVPVNTYGRSKLAGEQAVSEAFPAALIVRTSWLYSPWGVNFLTTMLRLAANRELVRVVDDQRGAPTAAVDLAEAILDIATQITAGVFRHRGGIYHVTAQGETTWHGFAKAIFAGWSHRGRRVPALAAIKTAEFPTAARRPANSRLDCRKIASDFGIRLPHWQDSLDACLDAFAAAQQETQSC
jgi:dTDP-4-dehydrorhamnose reductase